MTVFDFKFRCKQFQSFEEFQSAIVSPKVWKVDLFCFSVRRLGLFVFAIYFHRLQIIDVYLLTDGNLFIHLFTFLKEGCFVYV